MNILSHLKAQLAYWRWCYYDWRYGCKIDHASRLICPVCRTDINVLGGDSCVVAVVPCWSCWR